MSTLKERIAQEITEWERLSGGKRAQVLIEKSYLSDPSISRLIIIGGIVIDYFPELLSLTPQKSEFENKIEFAPLLKFLKFLGPRRNLLNRFIKIKSVETHNNQN